MNSSKVQIMSIKVIHTSLVLFDGMQMEEEKLVEGQQEEYNEEMLEEDEPRTALVCSLQSKQTYRFTQPKKGHKYLCTMWDGNGTKCNSRGFQNLKDLEKHIQKRHKNCFSCVWGCGGRFSCYSNMDLLQHVEDEHKEHVRLNTFCSSLIIAGVCQANSCMEYLALEPVTLLSSSPSSSSTITTSSSSSATTTFSSSDKN